MAWQDQLQPASFRRAGFKWQDTGLDGGRRNAVFEFPQRDTPYVEDLGRKLRRYQITGYVIGDTYFADRDALLDALEQGGPGTFVHPYYGTLTVVVEGFRTRETQREGRLATFEMSFLEAGELPSPRAVTDTASAVVSASGDVSTSLGASFRSRYAVSGFAPFVTSASTGLLAQLGSAASALLPIPGADLSGVTPLVAVLQTGAGGLAIDPVGIVNQVVGIFTGIADAVAAIAPAAPDPTAPTEISSRGMAAPSDPSFGLASFATWGASLPAVPTLTIDRAQQATNQQALVALVNGAAVIGMAQLYANTAFASSEDAEAARDQLTGLIDSQAVAADAAGQGDLYLGWQQLYSLVTDDLTTRGKQLPELSTYTTAGPLPALALAQRLYQDASRADELVARNAAPHPAFMPIAGEALAS